MYWLLFIPFVFCNILKLKENYLERLINQEITKAEEYQQRTDNSDFYGNSTDEKEVKNFGTFDFIVVGAGSSGSVVATRLSEKREWKILLLEAGVEEDDFSDIPQMNTFLPNSHRNWGYKTTRQKNGCQGMTNNQCPYHRGKSLGGSGSINGLIYIRGGKYDYDKWGHLSNPSWSYEKVVPYFRKLENAQIKNADYRYRGFGGAINVIEEPLPIFYHYFAQALKERANLVELDYNAQQQIGVGKMQTNTKFGKRTSGGNSYVTPARNRLNFNVTTKSFVTKILLDQNHRRAYGVQFIRNGIKFRAVATKEVIVSAGAVNTPQILMLSGIGPKKELTKHNIPIFQEAPVGLSLKDHISMTYSWRTNHTQNSKTTLKELIKDYLETGQGILSTSYSPSGLAFLKFNDTTGDRVDFVAEITTPLGGEINTASWKNYKEEVPSDSENKSFYDIVVNVALKRPVSQGQISLQSKNPKDFPLIDINIFSSEEDLRNLYRAIVFVNSLTESEGFKMYNATPHLSLKGCEQFQFNTKEFWYCAMRQVAIYGYHMSSTARMGRKCDPLAVVDSELKVFGVKSLRVVDLSIAPDTVAGNPNAAAFMIGEKAADLIKMEYLV